MATTVTQLLNSPVFYRLVPFSARRKHIPLQTEGRSRMEKERERVALTVLLLVVELRLREVHVKGDDERTADVDVVKVWEALSFLPHSGAGPGDLVSQNMDLFDSGRKTHQPILFTFFKHDKTLELFSFLPSYQNNDSTFCVSLNNLQGWLSCTNCSPA